MITLPVFYADRLYGELTFKEIKELVHTNTEVYNGAYLYKAYPPLEGWYRCDLTPCLEQDVPKATRLLKLLLT